MKKIAIYCVNYHSYDSLKNYLDSIETAKKSCNVAVFIADNTVPSKSFNYSPKSFTVKIFSIGENIGYFSAISYLMEEIKPNDFDLSIISNVDVLLKEDFFSKLISLPIEKGTGWIAPQIYSNIEQRDRNPKIMQRYAKRKLQILQTLFRFPMLYNLYTHTVYKSKKFIKHEQGKIYAGHGSFIILTREYFQYCGIIDYPVFLFCEEIYLAEQCRRHSLDVVYEPSICVIDAEHASTSTFKRSKYCHHNYEAISYILRTYYS